MLSRIIVAALLIAIGIFAAVRIYWTDIVAQPPSAAAFLGALAGGGLLAIILGAVINAELNRRRDDRLPDQEARALCLALASELRAVSSTAKAPAKWLASITTTGMVVAGLKLLEPPATPDFANTTDKIGFLPEPALDEIMATQMYIQQVGSGISALLADDPNTPLLAETLRNLGAQYVLLAVAADKAARIVDGEQPAEVSTK